VIGLTGLMPLWTVNAPGHDQLSDTGPRSQPTAGAEDTRRGADRQMGDTALD
jgi:hypothetical protein